MPFRKKASLYHHEARELLSVLWIIAFIAGLVVVGAAFVLADALEHLAK